MSAGAPITSAGAPSAPENAAWHRMRAMLDDELAARRN